MPQGQPHACEVKKIITRIKGGLGNQLFCYTAARRLALVNNAELVIDDVTGFVRDSLYRRRYMLDNFLIPVRKATPAERLEPFERYRRGVMKWLSRRRPFAERYYLEQEGIDFDERLLSVKVRGTLYLDGLWQGENYFKDMEVTIRQDLRMVPPKDEVNRKMARRISSCNAVAAHVRFFDKPDSINAQHNLDGNYYMRAAGEIMKRVDNPHFFLFSDNLTAARQMMRLPENQFTCVEHNQGEENACSDLWLMTHCRHFIIANSTFSWWGAWLAEGEAKIVVCPGMNLIRNGAITAWNFSGQIPDNWVQL